MICLLEKCSNLKEERQNKGHDDGNKQGKETMKGSCELMKNIGYAIVTLNVIVPAHHSNQKCFYPKRLGIRSLNRYLTRSLSILYVCELEAPVSTSED
jgi:hypothetical protein